MSELSLADFAAELSPPEPEAQPTEDASTETPVESEAEEPTSETPAPEAERPEGEEGEESGEEAEQAPALSDDTEIEWTTSSGETFKAPVKELKDGYMRQADYSQKTQQLAQAREAAQAEIQQQYQQIEAHAGDIALITNISARLQQFGKVNWDQLRAEDPQQWTALKLEERDLRDKAQQAVSALQGRKAQVTQAQQKQRDQEQASALEALKKDTPDFCRKHLEQMDAWALSHGLKQDDLPKLTHPTLLMAFHKAAQFDALQAKKPLVENRVKAIPPKATTAKAQSPTPKSKDEKVLTALKSNRAMRVTDFAGLLEATNRS